MPRSPVTARFARAFRPASLLLLLAVVAVAGLVAGAGAARRGAGTAPRIAVANPSRIFNEMQETRTLQAKMKDEQQRFATQQKEKMAELDQLKSSRDALKPSHPHYDDLNGQLMKAGINYKVWVDSQRLIAEQTQKRQMKNLFEKVEAAIAEVAKNKGINLVLADNKEPLPNDQDLETINFQTFRQLILQKQVLYANDRVDISQDVLVLLDARFKGAGAAPAAGGPAPLVNPVGPNK